MNYLFFDIECSDGKHMCSFGYVLANDKFEVLEKKDIVMNPESRFVLSANGKRPKISLAYSEDYFKKQKTFDHFYSKIKKILMKDNQLLFGHSILSDFHFLLYACNKYKLDEFKLTGYDIQKLYQDVSKADHVQSLENILIGLGENVEKITFHKSCDDAYATMLVAKDICEKKNQSLEELLNQYKDCFVDGRNLQVRKKNKSFNEEVEALRKEYLKVEKGVVAFDETFKKYSRKSQLELIKLLFKKGYNFTQKISECSFFITDRKNSNRECYCDRLIKNNYLIKKVELKYFFRNQELLDKILKSSFEYKKVKKTV